MKLRPLAIALALSAASCSVGPRYQPPAVSAPPAFKEEQGWKPATPAADRVRGDWWTVFADPELSALEQKLQVSNQTLQAAEARFRQARALVGVSRAARYPTVTGGAAISTNRQSSNRALRVGAGGSPFGDFLLPVDASYEADVWGRVRQSIEAARSGAQATAADLESVKLSLHAELALNYFELRSLDAEQKVLNDTVAAFERAYELTRNRFEGGVAAGAEVAQAKTQLDATRAQAIDIGVRRSQVEHAVAALIGMPPAEFQLAAKPLGGDPPRIPSGVPSQLLERRPDIAAAERRVAEANAQVGLARAAFFPTVMLQASAGLEGRSITNWLNWPSRLWSVGPSAVQTLFDAGRRRAISNAATANYDALVAKYRQTALDAFQQTEDQLAALRILAQESESQREAVESARTALELSTNRYVGGLVTYLEVVTSQSAVLANERAQVDLLRRRMQGTVLLVKALGGGWDVAQLPRP